ncbi:hypothetical protein [Legionella sp. 16cNR16C]|uniref:hypothetical protein n=1 Tax=Legionella sp. 16cNR16C TaxID=2905656 RepID=UPI001E43E4BD|nr:hypothetical protein [Legionella sp. 16cNR16C]MCE3046380.1 hypothetical protein [Legionella sp. 16cNR16C]
MKDKAEDSDKNIVKFISFRGVAPKRFRYIFRKNKLNRKKENKILEWNLQNSKAINLSHSTPLAYFWVETLYINKIRNYKDELSDEFCLVLDELLKTDLQEQFNLLLDIFKEDEITIN